MKRPEYVAAATAAVCAARNGVCDGELYETLRNVFSRSGFTDGYYTGHLGREMFGVRTRDDVVAAGDAIPKLHEIYRNERQCIPLTVFAEIRKNTPVRLTVSDGKNTVSVGGKIPQEAQNRPLDFEGVKKSVLKFGSTPYFAEKFTADIENGLFVSASALNELRRRAVELLDAARAVAPKIKEFPIDFSVADIRHSKNPSIIARFADADLMPENLSGVSAAVLPIFGKIPDRTENIIVELPRRIRDEDALFARLCELHQKGVKTVLCGNLAAVCLAQRSGMTVIGDIGLNVLNSLGAEVLSDLGVSAVTLSAETDIREAVKMATPLKKGLFAYGRLPLMLLENCPLKNGRVCRECDGKGFITDRKGVKFPVRCTVGVSELLNSVPIWLADRTRELSGLDYIYLRFDDESPEEARRVIDAYLKGAEPSGEFTRGLYYREVL